MAALAGTKRPFALLQNQLDSQPHALDLSVPRQSTVSTRSSSRQALQTASRTPSLSPERSPALDHVTRHFVDDASVILIGVRGSGKSTLGVIASAVFQRKLVETHHAFLEATGHSNAAYRKLFGSFQHQQQQLAVLKDVLCKHGEGCVIVCGNEAMDRRCQSLLREFCTTHPVVHVLRDTSSVGRHLSGLDPRRVHDLVRVGNKVHATCSNYEFYNISDNASDELTTHQTSQHSSFDNRTQSPFLTLKKTEKHFLKFIALITARKSLSALEAAYPLSNVPVDRRMYTYAVAVRLSELLENHVDIEQAESGSDAFELVVGGVYNTIRLTQFALDVSRVFAEVRRSTIVPIIYHVDMTIDQEHRTTTQRTDQQTEMHEGYLRAVMQGVRLGPDYLTIDLQLSDENIRKVVNAKGTAKIIGDICMYSGGPRWLDTWWIDQYQRAITLGCDAVRLRKRAMPLEDNTEVLLFREQIAAQPGSTVPLIAYNTGYHGRFSAIMNPILTTVDHKARSDPLTDDIGITARDCAAALASSFFYDPMKFYIIGASIGYSLSPSMHNAGFELCGLPHNYVKHQTSSLNSIQALMEDPFFGGASVTLPFKLEVIALTHSLSQHAKAIGAVNTLIPVRELQADGSVPDDVALLRQRNRAGTPCLALYGENTDWIGIRACVRRGLSPVNAVRPQTTALVLGAGGMSRAAVYAMLQLGVKNIFIHNRTQANAERLAEYYQTLIAEPQGCGASLKSGIVDDFGDVRLHVLPSKDTTWPSAFRQPTIIVSCIPTHSIGDNPAPNFTLPEPWLKSPTGGVVLEVAYKTLHTPLLQQIRAEAHRGWVAMDGLDLLPEQGFAQFELFTGRRAPRRLMRQQVLQQYRDSGVQDEGLIESRLAQLDNQEP